MHIGPDDIAFIFLIPCFVFLVLIVHELGHYAAARLFGLRISSVDIGWGKAFYTSSGKEGGPRWTFRILPFYAYVQLAGPQETKGKTFHSAPWPQKALTILAGPAASLVFPAVLFLAFFAAFGQPAEPPVIVAVEKGAAGERSGLQYGDRVMAVDGIPIRRFKDIDRLSYEDETPGASHIFTIRRGAEVLDIRVRPEWLSYTDIEGIPRRHRRLGVIWRHQPYGLSVVRAVNGADVAASHGKVRAALLENLGREVEIGLYSTDGTVRTYTGFLHRDANRHLNDKAHPDYKRFYLGAERDNAYLRFSLMENMRDAVLLNGELIGRIALVPFQLFPIDPDLKEGLVSIQNPGTWFANGLYRAVFLGAMLSVALGLLNLLPLPRLDMGHFVFAAREALGFPAATLKQQALFYALSFAVLYAAIVAANLDNLPGYIDSRMEKVQKLWIGQTENRN